ncbi:hypothetical protein EYF80_035893 [Liparis tanakae]|uniref:Uncharacterized protein n=1 Tax=Liparis tanakae TaxID=230148 RepID=A0A4Z2GKD5_9TELE|nr:hypothetical protein EYF80_035893 [Liparis tanakae]
MSISDCSLMIRRFKSAISALVDFRSSPCLPADCCISEYWSRQGAEVIRGNSISSDSSSILASSSTLTM